tara:strand:+ start:1137 stop:1796 length:660 start_codon:yes stop_codon:yes gene_type:complete
MNEFDKTLTLVTGASRGLGYQVAKLLAHKGNHIIGVAKTVGGLESLADEIATFGGTSTMAPINLEKDLELENLAITIFERWQKIDAFVHCAGIPAPMSPVTSISLKDFERSISVNTRSTLKLIQTLDPLLRQSKIRKAVFVDDTNSGKFLSSYASSKAATREIIKSYREESKRLGIKVITFKPEPMPTSIRAKFYPGEAKKNLSLCELQAKGLIEKADL